MENIKEANLSDGKNVEIKKEEVKENDTSCKIINIYETTELELDSNEDGVKGRIKFFKTYMTKEEADELYKDLVKDLKWQQKESSNIVGEKYPEPRLTFWYGRSYKYSKVSWPENENWYPKLKELKSALDNDSQLSPDPQRELNSVMCNYYRDNRDSIGWHADDETSLGRCPRIASISLGETRVFEVCKREEYYTRFGQPNLNQSAFAGCTLLYRLHLGNGSLLLMEGSVQDNWLHRVPKESKEMDGRINLTFRYIVDKEEELEEIKYKKKNRKQRELIIQRTQVTNNHNNSYKDEQLKYNNGKMIQNKLSNRNYNDKINQRFGNEIRRFDQGYEYDQRYQYSNGYQSDQRYERYQRYQNNKGYTVDQRYELYQGNQNNNGYHRDEGYNRDDSRNYYGQDNYYYPRKDYKYDNTSSDKKQENNDNSRRELTNYKKDFKRYPEVQSEQQRKERNTNSQLSSNFAKNMNEDKEDIKQDKQTNNVVQPILYNEYIKGKKGSRSQDKSEIGIIDLEKIMNDFERFNLNFPKLP